MSSKLAINKDIKNRLVFYKKQNQYRLIKLLMNDWYLPLEYRYTMFNDFTYFKKKIMIRTCIRNRCVISGRSKSVYSFLKLTRMVFKNLAVKGDILGITKHSW
jgi:ribosomal protein S14